MAHNTIKADTTITMASEMVDMGGRPSPEVQAAPPEKSGFDEIELAKAQLDNFTPEEERKLIRKIDLWIVPLMMVTYTLQSYDKGIMSAATQFGFNTDLGLTTIIGHTATGTAITNNQKYSNASMIFYIGYLCGT